MDWWTALPFGKADQHSELPVSTKDGIRSVQIMCAKPSVPQSKGNWNVVRNFVNKTAG